MKSQEIQGRVVHRKDPMWQKGRILNDAEIQLVRVHIVL